MFGSVTTRSITRHRRRRRSPPESRLSTATSVRSTGCVRAASAHSLTLPAVGIAAVQRQCIRQHRSPRLLRRADTPGRAPRQIRPQSIDVPPRSLERAPPPRRDVAEQQRIAHPRLDVGDEKRSPTSPAIRDGDRLRLAGDDVPASWSYTAPVASGPSLRQIAARRPPAPCAELEHRRLRAPAARCSPRPAHHGRVSSTRITSGILRGIRKDNHGPHGRRRRRWRLPQVVRRPMRRRHFVEFPRLARPHVLRHPRDRSAGPHAMASG